jgi:hypothetical protein
MDTQEHGAEVDMIRVGRGMSDDDKWAEVTRGELGLLEVPEDWCRGNVDNKKSLTLKTGWQCTGQHGAWHGGQHHL